MHTYPKKFEQRLVGEFLRPAEVEAGQAAALEGARDGVEALVS